jgi:RNA polymerase sigma-70 factor (ECF subfamily)
MSADAGDEALLLRYQRGDRGAFAQLVRRYQAPVYNFVLRQLGSALPAHEIAQEAFLGVIREGSRYSEETPFASRLFSIALRLVREERAKMPPRAVRADDSRIPESGLSRTARAPRETLEDSTVRAVDELPDDQKDVFLLREVADLSFPQIARVTGQTDNAVKVQMHHALSHLRIALQDFDEYRRALR